MSLQFTLQLGSCTAKSKLSRFIAQTVVHGSLERKVCVCREITKDFRRDLEGTAMVQITLNKQRTANNHNCSHQLSSTEGDV